MAKRSFALVGLVVVLGLTGCASRASVGVASAPPPSSSSPSPSPPPSPPSPSASTVLLDEKANHTTVKVGVGATVRVDLHSSYWSPVASSAPQILALVGSTAAPAVTNPAGAPCHPGAGCGTVTSTFTAQQAGTAQLTASRTTCGEAMVCPPDQRSYAVTVEVTP